MNLEESTYMGYERWLPSPPKVEKPRSSHNAAALAYIGDSIYEVCVYSLASLIFLCSSIGFCKKKSCCVFLSPACVYLS